MKDKSNIFSVFMVVGIVLIIAIIFLLLKMYTTIFNGQTLVPQVSTSTTSSSPIPTPTSTSNNTISTSTIIQVTSPLSGQIISSPFTVQGQARGNWYFEASFPLKIVDANEKILAQKPIAAQGDWMTTDFVPFSTIVMFTTPTAQTGFVIFEKDNPSGLPQNAAQYRVPVQFLNFVTPTSTMVKVFFGNAKLLKAGQDDCTTVFSVDRVVPYTLGVGRAAITELLKGPSSAEKTDGYFTSLNTGINIQSLTIENGVAKIDFNKKLDEAVGGSCRVAAISAQIRETLKQFPTVQDVVISIDGRTEDILQP
ncbi:MAG: hypothetical protein A3B90_00585 [Candidatus Magasanikbacteria bacterium RIFCSPHIGHO2_02_FULL_41_13]|uniref:GerMN domain-containing protein n=1 Tax=Candidatus Magasanikbacteria bacterium RIFCSPHIGHO2_02_FULL_41_13 TaxID=1798676 RepID=A0A1F6M610_9BACT|nr:MAG: hypothetical protein A3B90_00585 [Candidatus Magasanikbacteria bacterium RIFCSPHIGHO2_02_FULL_41_13]